jgi:flagellin-like hook-associated protein FlgL
MSTILTGYGASAWTRQLGNLRQSLDELQRQMATGEKATTYAGLGGERSLAVGLQLRLSGFDGYQQTIDQVSVRIDLSERSLSRIDALANESKPNLRATDFDLRGGRQTVQQTLVRGRLQEVLDLLNMRADDRFLFGGRAVDREPVEGIDSILNGDPATGRDGLRQLIADRRLADLGTGERGRLTVDPASGTSVTLRRDHVGTEFGLRLGGVSSTSPAIAATGPSGSPPQVNFSVVSQPSVGDIVRVGLQLPDGSTETIELRAMAAPADKDAFAIGATTTETAANLRARMGEAVEDMAATKLAAASATQAGREFFRLDSGEVPLRVAGHTLTAEPARSNALRAATGLVDATATDTVFWYRGEIAADAPRETATARVDDSISVAYGARANEAGLRRIVESLAVFAAEEFDPADPRAGDRYLALADRAADGLDRPQGGLTLQGMIVEISTAKITMDRANERHDMARGQALTMLDEVRGVDTQEAAAKILTLQTRLQASYQTTAILSRLSLVDYL